MQSLPCLCFSLLWLFLFAFVDVRRNSESAPRSNGEQKINSLDSVSENGGLGSGKGPRGSVTPKEKKIEWKKGELIGKGSFGKVTRILSFRNYFSQSSSCDLFQVYM